MRLRRALLALTAALVLHGLAALVVLDARGLPGPSAPHLARVELALVAPAAARAIATPSTSTPAPPIAPSIAPSPSTNAPSHDEAAPSTNAPSRDEPAPVVASPSPGRATPSTPRSFLERVLAGANGGPQPSVDVLDPSRAQEARATDGQRAKRRIDEVAHAEPRDAGPVVLALEPLDNGGYRYKTGGFVAVIDVDGSVTFHDAGTKTGLGNSAIDDDPSHGVIAPGSPVDATSPRIAATGVIGSVSFDPTAALLRAQGQDPYEAERSCFLDDTRALRADLREKHELLQLADLRRALEHAWLDDPRPAVERRAFVFAIWDECREEGVGVRARQLVESFVRQHLPKDSPDAYGVDELVALNAHRASKDEFKPYGS